MTIASKIEALEAEIRHGKDLVNDLVKAAEAEDRDLTEVESEEIETINTQMEAKEKSLEGYRAAEQALGRKLHVPGVVKSGNLGSGKDRPKGDLIVKMATNAALARYARISQEEMVERAYRDDAELRDVVKDTVGFGTTTTPGFAQELVQSATGDFLDAVRPGTVYGALAAAGVTIPFGNKQSIALPAMGATGGMAGGWVKDP